MGAKILVEPLEFPPLKKYEYFCLFCPIYLDYGIQKALLAAQENTNKMLIRTNGLFGVGLLKGV